MFPPNSKSIEDLWQEDDLRFDKLLLKYDNTQSLELPDEFFVQDLISSTTPSQSINPSNPPTPGRSLSRNEKIVRLSQRMNRPKFADLNRKRLEQVRKDRALKEDDSIMNMTVKQRIPVKRKR